MRRKLDTHIPIVLSGFSGSGKDTVASHIERSMHPLNTQTKFHRSRCRYTDRPRRTDELHGVDGQFVTPEDFSMLTEAGEFFFHYGKPEYGGTRYGFSLPILKGELKNAHTFVVGGEVHTAQDLFLGLNHTIQGVQDALKPIMLFINRPAEAIIRDIRARPASDEEIQRRIQHVEGSWELKPQILEGLQGEYGDRIVFVLNDDLETSVPTAIDAIMRNVDAQHKNLYGNKASILTI